MPSFDLVSEINKGELKNAIDQARREISTRYDFKGSDASIEHEKDKIVIEASNEYQVKASVDILRSKMIKRGIGVKSLNLNDVIPTGNQRFKVEGEFKSGIGKEDGKKINKMLKESKLKLSSSYLDEKVRVTGKKIDDLQAAFKMLKSSDDIELDLQMENMKS
ncbi:MAG: YajQ family cyclic di-GMP-binding protein [Halobacteriovoraceae bacterium]|nr:YajQ family cyclic di-GMP-binding protein [Halobacteriovoraceae bacterium]